MNVIFLMIAFPEGSERGMYNELAEEFAKNDHNVYVIAPAISKEGIFKDHDLTILRVKTMKLFNVNPILKGIGNILLPYQYLKAIKKHFSSVKFDLIILPTPPITLVDSVKFLKRRDNCNSYLILRDIFPQNAMDLGLIRNKLIFNYFRRKEKILYNLVDFIGCMSIGNINYVKLHNPEVDPGKLHILENWHFAPEWQVPEEDIKGKFGIEGKFVAIFGGNLGVPQKTEFLVEIAEKISNMEDIFFLIVGKGTEKSKIEALIKNKKLKNIALINHVPKDEFIKLSRACNVGLVNLSDKFTIPNIPSRTLSYWAVKLPVLAAIDKNTDFGSYLDKVKGGLWSITSDTDSYIKNLLYFYNNKVEAKEMGINGYNYLIRELNPFETYCKIVQNFESKYV